MAPAPKARYQRRLSQGGRPVIDGTDGKSSEDTKVGEEDALDTGENGKNQINPISELGQTRDKATSPMGGTLLLRRSSAGIDGRMENVPVRASFNDIKQHLKHLGPSNPASNPKITRSTTVKIKPGIIVHEPPPSESIAEEVIVEGTESEDDNETTSLLKGKITPKDGAHALAQSYGATGVGSQARGAENTPLSKTADTTKQEEHGTQTSTHPSATDLKVAASFRQDSRSLRSSSGSETSPVDSLSPNTARRSLLARSGSITEQVVETRGIKKTVLETTSSNDEEEEHGYHRTASRSNISLSSTRALSPRDKSATPSVTSPTTEEHAEGGSSTGNASNPNGSSNGGAKKKTRRKKRKGKF